jgi:hypothetical protein
MLADEVDYVIGVDTHRDQHTLAVVAAPTGAVRAQEVVRASARRYADALRFAERYTRGVRVWAVEGVATTAPASPATSARTVKRCSKSAATPAASGDCAAKTTHSMRSAQRVRGLRQRR